MRRGEVWRVRFPFGLGRTQAGERPAVIVQNDQLNRNLPTTLTIPFTSKLRSATMFTGATLLVQPDGQNGLSVPSVALVFQLTNVDKTQCIQRLGELDSQTLDAILAVLDQIVH